MNRAAARLHLTQPATTRRIQSFEAAIGGAELFDRSVKPAVLTALGNHVLEHCRRVLATVAELEACATSKAIPAGELKLGIAHGLGEMVLTTPLVALRQAFPQVRLQISSNWTAGLIEEVRSGAIDFAVGLLTEAHTVPARLLRVPLGDEQIVVVSASKSATKHDGTPWQLSDLTEEGWMLNPVGCGCRAMLTKALDRLRLPLHISAEVFGEDLQLSLLANTGGLCLVPQRQFEHSPYRHDLQALNVLDFSISATITLIRNAMPIRFDPVVETIVHVLRDKLGPQLPSA